MRRNLGRYYAMMLFFIGAMAGLVLTSNLLLMFVFWEITALCSYVLISFNCDDPKAVYGGIKALIMTQLGGIGLLGGALLIYSQTGSYDLNLFLEKASTLPAEYPEPGCIRIPGGSGGQVGAVPFSNLAPGCNGSSHPHKRA